MNVICIVQSRFGSARLPGKSMKPIAGQPMLWHVLTRARQIVGVDHVVLATTDEARDAPLAALAVELGVPCFRHSGVEADVLSRFEAVADRFSPDVIVRITGDCPLLDPAIAARVLSAFADGVDYVTNDTTQSGYPDGLDVEIFSREALRKAHLAVPRFIPGKTITTRDAQQDREHVTPWMRRRCPWRLCKNPDEIGANFAAAKLSCDTAEDLERIRGVFGFLDGGATDLDATFRAWSKFVANGRKR